VVSWPEYQSDPEPAPQTWPPVADWQLHRQIVEVAKRAGVTHGRRSRIDTTVVETNVHYSTDSTLLQDGVRVLTRCSGPVRPRAIRADTFAIADAVSGVVC
jgi:hypothetical protein